LSTLQQHQPAKEGSMETDVLVKVDEQFWLLWTATAVQLGWESFCTITLAPSSLFQVMPGPMVTSERNGILIL
jgi:hypothetical protein